MPRKTMQQKIKAAIPSLLTASPCNGTPLEVRPLNASAGLFWVNDQFLFKWMDGNTETSKFVSPKAVRAAFSREPVDSGWLPPGIVRCGTSARGDYEAMFIPAHIRDLVFVNCAWFLEENRQEKNVTIKVYLPSLFFTGLGPEYVLFAAAEETFNPAMKLFHVPLPNVDERGHICWGATQPPRAGNGSIGRAWETFCATPFSSHSVRNKSAIYKDDIREKYGKWPLASCETDLVPTAGFLTPDIVFRSLSGY